MEFHRFFEAGKCEVMRDAGMSSGNGFENSNSLFVAAVLAEQVHNFFVSIFGRLA